MRIIGLSIGYASYDVEREVLGAAGLSFDHFDNLADIHAPMDVTAIMVRQHPIDEQVMQQFPNLRMIQRYGVGVYNVDLHAAARRNITVCNTPDYGQEHEVSDHAMALYLALSRNIVSRDAEVRGGKWGIDQADPIVGHRGATLGLIGFGRIAQATWRKFHALGFAKCLVSDPAITQDNAAALGVQRASVSEI